MHYNLNPSADKWKPTVTTPSYYNFLCTHIKIEIMYKVLNFKNQNLENFDFIFNIFFKRFRICIF